MVVREKKTGSEKERDIDQRKREIYKKKKERVSEK